MPYFRGVVTFSTVGQAHAYWINALLDAHPQLVGFPEEVVSFHNWWREDYASLSFELVVESFMNDHQVLFSGGTFEELDSDDQGSQFALFVNRFWHLRYDMRFDLGETNPTHLQHPRIPEERFREALLSLQEPYARTSAGQFFTAIHVALARTRQIALNPVETWIVNAAHQHSRSSLNLIRQISGSRRGISIVREPFPAILTARFPGTGEHLEICNRGIINSVRRDSRSHPDLFKWNEAMRIEDLYRDPHTVLSTLCQRLDIDWNDSLLQPTFFGVPWTWMADPPGTPTFHLPRLRRYEDLQATHLGARCAAHALTDLYDRWNYQLPRHRFGLVEAVRYALGIGSDVGDAPLRTRIGMLLELIRNKFKHRSHQAVPLMSLPDSAETRDPYR
jgi:hypothetical protein